MTLLTSVIFLVQHGRGAGPLQSFLSEQRVLSRNVPVGWVRIVVSITDDRMRKRSICYLRSVLFHELSGAGLVQSVLLRDDTLAQTVRHMVRAEQGDDDHSNLSRDQSESGRVPSFHSSSFELEVLGLAARKNRSGEASVRRHRFDERRVVSAAVKLHQSPVSDVRRRCCMYAPSLPNSGF